MKAFNSFSFFHIFASLVDLSWMVRLYQKARKACRREEALKPTLPRSSRGLILKAGPISPNRAWRVDEGNPLLAPCPFLKNLSLRGAAVAIFPFIKKFSLFTGLNALKLCYRGFKFLSVIPVKTGIQKDWISGSSPNMTNYGGFKYA